ncbi:MAG: class I SAM-dependent methyltransferase, partial [Planctomycetes bacterium]|nr:class I SAM-dependent methyltransferase [Planctomycetota bacterium]
MEIQLPQGLVKISDYNVLLQSELFSRMEKFSNGFVAQNNEILSAYRRKWVMDPLHQWSRQWEYPFVFSQIEKYAAARGGRPIKILDAGSGITFFPYFLKQAIGAAALTCCDAGLSLPEMFRTINTQMGTDVKFLCRDIRDTALESSSFDIVYCVSVLEHTKNYDEIIKEFVRLLKDDGILIVTFDISLDGRSDIPVSEVKKLVTSLQNYLSPTDQGSTIRLLDEEKLFSPAIITTAFVSGWNESLLPWK